MIAYTWVKNLQWAIIQSIQFLPSVDLSIVNKQRLFPEIAEVHSLESLLIITRSSPYINNVVLACAVLTLKNVQYLLHTVLRISESTSYNLILTIIKRFSSAIVNIGKD